MVNLSLSTFKILSGTGGCGALRAGGLRTEICTCTDLMRVEPLPGYQRTLRSLENVNLLEIICIMYDDK